MADFGNQFRSAREAKGISLDQLAQETRISARFLRAIEDEVFETLPGGLFNRGFIRTYASKVGLDPAEAVRTYERLTSTVDPDTSPAASARAAIEQPDRHVVPLAVSGLVVTIVLFYVFDLREAPTPQDLGAQLETISRPAENPERGSTAVQTAAATPEATAPPAAAVEEDIPVQRPGITVQVQVKEATWLLVQSDGREEEFLLDPGASELYTADDALSLKIGNAAGVTLNWNGQQFDNLGVTGQVLTLSITPDGIGGLAGNQESRPSNGPSA